MRPDPAALWISLPRDTISDLLHKELLGGRNGTPMPSNQSTIDVLGMVDEVLSAWNESSN